MSDLISRADLMQFPIRIDHYDKENGNENFVLGIESVLEFAEYLPAVDAVEVVHAEWITTEIYSGMYRANLSETTCSACGKRPNIYMLKSEYCPNCGAKMDKRRESEVSE